MQASTGSGSAGRYNPDMTPAPPRVVFFDVDFTLIRPGPRFQGEGYRDVCAEHGIAVDPDRFHAAVASASAILDRVQTHIYDPELFIDYTQHVIEQMGGQGQAVRRCAREMFERWAENHHFELYDDVPEGLRALHTRGLRLGLISNTHRSLSAFESHFELDGLIAVAVSSSVHGYMKPHPSIFEAALTLADAVPEEAVMVGDSYRHDIEGALQVGMRAVLLCRSGQCAEGGNGVPVVRDLFELAALL